MTTHTKSGPKPQGRKRLERTLKLLLESKASSASVHAQVSGQCAEGWLTLQKAGKPLGLDQPELFGLLLHYGYTHVLEVLRRERAERETDTNPNPQVEG